MPLRTPSRCFFTRSHEAERPEIEAHKKCSSWPRIPVPAQKMIVARGGVPLTRRDARSYGYGRVCSMEAFFLLYRRAAGVGNVKITR